MTLDIGQRVRTLIDLDSADWAPEQPDIPAGALGTIDHIFYAHNDPTAVTSYSVMLDDSADRLAVSMNPDELEPATD